MSKYFVDGQDLTDIADAIREGLASTESLEFPDDFINGIEDLGGGITPTGTKEIAVTVNTTSTTDIERYKYVKIVSNVPNSYSAEDEGKVVQTGTLVAQSAMTASTNDTYDTTLYNSVVVAVPTGGFTPADEGKVVYNGALVSQTSGSVNTDGTYDTTLINSMTVSVGGGGGSGAALISTGTFSGADTNNVSINIGTSAPIKDFILTLWADSATVFAYDTYYKITAGTIVVPGDLCEFVFSSSQSTYDEYQRSFTKSYDVNNSGAITSLASNGVCGSLSYVRNNGNGGVFVNINGGGLTIRKYSDHFEIYYTQGNNSYHFVNNVTYHYNLYYTGANPSTDIMTIS